MTILQIFGAVLGASGVWKVVEILIQFRMQKRLKKAEINNLNAQANSLVVENYKLWTENMDRRIKELESKNVSQRKRIGKLESKNAEMSQTIIKQRERINELEAEIKKYKK